MTITTEQIIELARQNAHHALMKSSCELCIDDAEKLLANGDIRHANQRALKSLAYSLGIFHHVYQEVKREISEMENNKTNSQDMVI